ncbi:MAG: ABC transporter permease [Betaproteobacteria bacterium HGW-Betaproteobacteria-5]|jgi:putative ABC transport system permease protein|nr:MAG: ABC transporter permease [Betaproteobacteria bacterium HGW-Betaproteobacteria-5]PKO37604.1 MAG: ABC transporter permease [Betaproteobacteria bacterium HGW-Betaproteobacteria-6]
MIKLVADLRIAILNLRRNSRRTLVATLSVAGGVIAFLLAGGFIAWIFHDMREATIHSQLGHIQIVRPGYFEKGIADPYAYLLPPASPEQRLIEKHPNVITLTPRIAFNGLLSLGEATIPFIGEGIDPERERPISTRITIIEGDELKNSGEHSVLLGEGLAKNIGAKVGDTVVLLVSSANGSPNAVEVKVSGTFSTITKEYDDNALRLPLQVARKLMRLDGATTWIVLLDATENTETVAQAIKSKLPETSYTLVRWHELAEFYNKTVTLFSKQVDVVKFIIALIIILTISNTQTMSVLERTTEIGTSLALGLRSSEILRMFILEGFMIGIAGGGLGVLIGYTLSQLISEVGIPMPPPPGMARGFTGQILVNWNLAVDGLILAISTTLLASLMPAWKASKMKIVDALRTNQ